jgi:hypothetical protein
MGEIGPRTGKTDGADDDEYYATGYPKDLSRTPGGPLDDARRRLRFIGNSSAQVLSLALLSSVEPPRFSLSSP